MESCQLHATLAPDLIHLQNGVLCRLLEGEVFPVSDTPSAVLLMGETGVGKELVARALHQNSSRSGEAFVAINCAAFTSTLIESELFGYERGAFTGATNLRHGLFERANRGTVFLDEIGELSSEAQAKLLRVLQEKTICRVGGSRDISVDFRLVSATNCNLEEMVGEKKFRKDLYYRINTVLIRVPPLRERRDDITLLTEYLIKKKARELKRSVETVSPEVQEIFMKYSWAGNIRDLENVIERMVGCARLPTLTTALLPLDFRSNAQEDEVTTVSNVEPANATSQQAIIMFVDDLLSNRDAFVEAAKSYELVEKVRGLCGYTDAATIEIETVSPSDLPKEKEGLRQKLAHTILLITDLNFQMDDQVWVNGQELLAYVLETCPDLYLKTIWLTRHGDDVRIKEYVREARRTLSKDPIFANRVEEVLTKIPRVAVHALVPPPLPRATDPWWMMLWVAIRHTLETSTRASQILHAAHKGQRLGSKVNSLHSGADTAAAPPLPANSERVAEELASKICEYEDATAFRRRVVDAFIWAEANKPDVPRANPPWLKSLWRSLKVELLRLWQAGRLKIALDAEAKKTAEERVRAQIDMALRAGFKEVQWPIPKGREQ